MQVLKIYEYPNCSTCKKALKFLLNNRFAVEKVDIFQQPPTLAELKQMLAFQKGNIRALFNANGRLYQEQGLKDKIGTMSEDDALKLLAGDGRLVKRPFILTEKMGLVGFDPKVWKVALGLAESS